jgi:hypothetical protein
MHGYHVDYQYEKDENHNQVPIVEGHLPDDAPRQLFRMPELFQEIEGDVLPEEMETHDVHEVKKDGQTIGNDIDKVDNPLRHLIDDFPRGETIIENQRQVDDHEDGQIEAHPLEIQSQRLAKPQLVKKLQVEKIKQPTADADCQKNSQQPVNKQYGR